MSNIVKTNTALSIFWSILSKWSSKLIGMVSTMVLARLLTPADFGIIAIATIVIAFLDSITDAGLNLYVLRQKSDNRQVFNTAWTIGVLQGVIVALPLVFCAHWIAEFYNQIVLTEVIYCLALARIIQGFNSLGIVLAQKQLNFQIEFKYTLLTRLSYLGATIGFAIVFPSFWALVFGQLFASIVGCAISYLVHPYRPQFSMFAWRQILHFSKHTVPFSFGRYINNQLDVAVIGRIAAAEFIGLYHVATNLASLFTKELLIPVIRGLIPNLAIQQQSSEFDKVLMITFTTAIYLFLPIGIGLSMVADEFVSVLLGSQWLEAGPLLKWFSLYAMLGGVMMFFSEQFLVVMSKEALSNRLMWLRNLVLICTLTLTLWKYSVTEIPKALFISALMTLPFILWKICRELRLSLFLLLTAWWPALISVFIMAVALYFLPMLQDSVFITLIYKVLFAISIYTLCLFLCYLFRGRPSASIEYLLISRWLAK